MGLTEQFRRCLQGQVCLVGLGNVERGDDGVGVRLVEALADEGFACVVAGTMPERHVGGLAQKGYDNVVFVDAVDFGGAPGSVILLNAEQMDSRFPQVSTHKVSLGLLARWLEANGTTRAWLLGVQPESLAQPGLSAAVRQTVGTLRALLKEMQAEAVA